MTSTDAIWPEVGMGCTTGYGADFYPHTIIKITRRDKDGFPTEFVMQDDKAVAKPGSDIYGKQDYEYDANPYGDVDVVRLGRDGKWKISGDTHVVLVGFRRYHRDPSF